MNLHDRDIRMKEKEETAKNMILAGLGSIEQISKITNLDITRVQSLHKECTKISQKN